jgi:hypothetical protein
MVTKSGGTATEAVDAAGKWTGGNNTRRLLKEYVALIKLRDGGTHSCTEHQINPDEKTGDSKQDISCIPRKGLKRVLISLLNYEKTANIFVSCWERLSREFVVAEKGGRVGSAWLP